MHASLSDSGIELVRRYERLPELTARLVKRIPAGLDFDDLLSAGNHGLCVAASKFDPSRDVEFRTYAITLIWGAIREMFRKWDPYPRVMRARARAGTGQCPPTLSLDTTVQSDVKRQESHSQSFAELLVSQEQPPWEYAVEQLEKAAIWRGVARLPDRERSIVMAHYVEKLTLAAIGERMGISQSRVYQLRNQALERLRFRLSADLTV